MKKINSTFCGGEPWWANACVGNNGNPGYIEYSRGFSTAANVLIDQVLANHGIGLSVDTLIYPTCFNMRHSVELRLKGSIQELSEIAEIKGLKISFDLAGSHDIGNIWIFFKENSEALDSRYIKINKKINSTICDIASIDATGQTFRYPVNTESQKHLTEVSSINFQNLKDKFKLLETNIETLHNLNIWLKTEYSHKTFTTNLSRNEIYRIARKLPNLSEWGHPKFDAIKQDLRTTYSISNRELSYAINLIKQHYSLAPFIGSPIPIKGITNHQLFEFLDEWTQQNEESINPTRSEDNFSFLDISDCYLSEMQERITRRNLTREKFKNKLTASYLAGLSSLFYFSYEPEFTEHYKALYEIELIEKTNNTINDESYFIDAFMHIFDKTNAIQNIVTSLYRLEHIELAETILSKYKVASSLEWIENARVRTQSLYPDFAEY